MVYYIFFALESKKSLAPRNRSQALFYLDANIYNKDRPLLIVYKAVLTVFMLYVYDQNIDTILKRRQVKKAIAKIAATHAK